MSRNWTTSTTRYKQEAQPMLRNMRDAISSGGWKSIGNITGWYRMRREY